MEQYDARKEIEIIDKAVELLSNDLDKCALRGDVTYNIYAIAVIALGMASIAKTLIRFTDESSGSRT